MFCTQCGTNNPDGANHCVTCGAAMNAKKTQSGRKFLLPCVIGAAVLIAAIALIVTLGSGEGKESGKSENSKTSPIANFYRGQEKADVDMYLSAFPKEITENVDKDELEDELKTSQRYRQMEGGEDFRLSFIVIGEEEWHKDDVKDFAELLAYYYDIDADKITEVWFIECDLTFNGIVSETTELTVFKYKGTWYLSPSML